MPRLTHVDEHGQAGMVDVSDKPMSKRRAVAEGFFVARPATIDALMAGELPKGEAMAVARIAGVSAAKRTGDLIPLCHPVGLDHVAVSFERVADGQLRIEASAQVTARTGIEMEALTAVSVAALTLWDMTKAVDADLRIEHIRLLEKTKQPVSD